jgi:hypothetical protein
LFLALALCGLLAAPVALANEPEQEEQAVLTLKDVKQRLKENEKFLKEARKQGRAGNAAGMEVALENYSRGMEGLNRALEQGHFNGDVYDREDAFNRVEKATRKHGEVLAELYHRVPDKAKPAIAHAQEVSQRGRVTALENLERARAQRNAETRTTGRPDSAGRPDFGGRPSGVGEAPAGAGVGGAGRPGGGPPSGRPGGGRP